MEKLWLKSYEQGVNPEIDISQYSSISDVFRQSVEKFSDKPAFQNMGKTLTYAEVGKLATDATITCLICVRGNTNSSVLAKFSNTTIVVAPLSFN